MKTSNLWSALVLCCIACGSSFHSGDAATGGDGSGGSLGSGGSEVGGGGTHSGAGTSSGAGTHSGAGTSSGGVIGVGGDLSIAGSVSTGGIIGVGGDIGIAGAPMGGSVGSAGGPSGGASGSVGSGGSAGMAGSGGTTGADCTKLWTTYWNLVLKAQACDAGSTSCVANSNIINECSCAVPVNSSGSTYSEAKKALQTYKAASCPLKQCPCAVPGPVSCLPSSGTSTYSCQPSVVTTQ